MIKLSRSSFLRVLGTGVIAALVQNTPVSALARTPNSSDIDMENIRDELNDW